MNYDKVIAQAARDWMKARDWAAISGPIGDEDANEAFNKLAWLIEAEKHGWNPDDYKPEN